MLNRQVLLAAIGIALLAAALAVTAANAQGGGRGNGPVIYVTSQGLFYDSIVNGDLPMHGRFQKLEMAGQTGLQTEWGPGDRNHVGGRWWVDVNNNNMMDEEDDFFSCPLLGPGRSEP